MSSTHASGHDGLTQCEPMVKRFIDGGWDTQWTRGATTSRGYAWVARPRSPLFCSSKKGPVRVLETKGLRFILTRESDWLLLNRSLQ